LPGASGARLCEPQHVQQPQNQRDSLRPIEPWAARPCSADWQSAVSPTGSRPGVGDLSVWRINHPRRSIQTACATATSRSVEHCSAAPFSILDPTASLAAALPHRMFRAMRFIARHSTKMGKYEYATVADYCNPLWHRPLPRRFAAPK
jgi:hypothetical protein